MTGTQLPDPVPTLQGITRNGKVCAIQDNTAELSADDLQPILDDLIRSNLFGFKALSDRQGRLSIDEAQLGHVQINGRLYRLIVKGYNAFIEKF